MGTTLMGGDKASDVWIEAVCESRRRYLAFGAGRTGSLESGVWCADKTGDKCDPVLVDIPISLPLSFI